MDTDTPAPAGPALREYTALLRRRWRLVGAGVLGGLVLGGAAVLALPASYTSVTAVQVQPTGLGEFTGERSGRLTGDVNLDTEAQILVSDEVSSVVAGALAEGGRAPATEELRERVEVSVPPNSNVLEIAFSAPTPEAARAGARGYAEAYLELRRAQVDDLAASRLEALRAEQENLYEALAESAAEDPFSPGTSARVDALRQEITELGNGISPLSALRETVRPGRVITPADLPEDPSGPVPALWLVGGAALGLLAGLLAAVSRDRLDPRLHDTEDTARVSGLPVLLDLSERKRRGGRRPGLLDEDDRAGQRVNEFTHLVRARLTGAPADRPAAPDPLAEALGEGAAAGHVLLVAPTTPGRAGSAAAVNLAAALARTGSETLLVCADPRTDTVGELLGLPEGPGLAEALLDGEDPADLEVRPDAVPRLRVLRYGSPGMNAPVQGTAMPELVRLLRARAEYVVLAAASVGERADVHALAASSDVLLPVVELGLTRRTDLAALLTLAERFGVPAPGTAVLPCQPLAAPAPVPTAEGSGTNRGYGPAGAAGAPAASEAAEPEGTGAAAGVTEVGESREDTAKAAPHDEDADAAVVDGAAPGDGGTDGSGSALREGEDGGSAAIAADGTGSPAEEGAEGADTADTDSPGAMGAAAPEALPGGEDARAPEAAADGGGSDGEASVPAETASGARN
ncbi:MULTISPECIES: lipopolysaccharide biosynthesis protein [unclassified Nocardiopsis]|uniref:lipopolysaccharide biosynthesis protein n=1 Tax=unclassified Nocardiopsis TaxID=2649073 RepID=UPI0013583949|nr:MULTISPECIES: lipopolysaccharide biosynthesis protein [unclassified Nocardiopsis]